MIKTLLWGRNTIPTLGRFLMSNSLEADQHPKPKSYRMPEEKPIELFRPSSPVRMHNHRVLLFLNKQNLFTPMLLQTPYCLSFFGLIYLIRYNPWYLTFPASLPLMIGLEIAIFLTWILHKRHYKYMVERIYLYRGNFVEFIYSNKIRRRLKNTEGEEMFPSPDQLVTPPHNEDGSPAWTQKGARFPETLKYKRNAVTGEVQFEEPAKPFMLYGWTKYADNFQNFIFPKYYEYANWQILVPLMSGRYIDLSDSINDIDEFMSDEVYPPIQQELKWIKEDQIKTEQAKKEANKITENTSQLPEK